MVTVTRIVSRTPAIPETVGTFEIFWQLRPETVTVQMIVTRAPAILVTVGTFEMTSTKGDSYENCTSEAAKTRTVTRVATWTPTIPVTVHTFEPLD